MGPLPEFRNQRRAWYNPALRSLDFEVVSMLTTAVMMIAIILPAAGLAAEKEAGTIEQLLVMPFRPWELMLAKVIPTLVVSLVSLALALWLPWWFEVPIRGRLGLFFALSALFLMSSLGFGLWLGTLVANLQQALLLSFFTVVPVLVISGGLVPIESMPRGIQALSLLSPLRYYYEIRVRDLSQRRGDRGAVASGARPRSARGRTVRPRRQGLPKADPLTRGEDRDGAARDFRAGAQPSPKA